MLRFFYIGGILTKYAFLYLLMRVRLYKVPQNKVIKRFFEEAGGSFIKFGQLLALRVDILPKEYSLDMLDLLDNVKAFSYSDVKEVFLSDLGATPEKIFKDFQKEPFASGSFGQVHAAKLDDDSIVAVKIMRPGIEEQVQADFIVITILAYIADYFFRVSGLSWRELADEFKQWTLKELDYHLEADNADRMAKNMTDNPIIVIPKTYNRLSTKRILVQEYIEGFHLSRILRGFKDGRLDAKSLKEYGVDIKIFTHNLTQEILNQYFYYGFFHADLHPGNIILLPKNRIALIDYGIMGEWIPSSQLSLIRFMRSVGDYSFKEATYYFADVVSTDLKRMILSAFPASVDQKDIDQFLRLITDHFAESVESIVGGSIKDLSEMKTDYTTLLLQIINATKSYKIKIPKEMAIFIKALSTLGLLSKELNKDFRLQKEIKYFFDHHSEDSFPLLKSQSTYKRISREKAMERLNSWLAYLLEVDPTIYTLVHGYINKYNQVDQ